MTEANPENVPPSSVPKLERLTYSVAESAEVLGVSQPTIYRLIQRRILRPVHGIRHKLIPCAQIRRLVGSDSLRASGLPGAN